MSNDKIQYILSSHGVLNYVSKGFIFAYDEYYDTILKSTGGKWVDVTGYSVNQMRDFLNY